MITPYKYRYTLGRFNPRTIKGKHIIILDGIQREIDNTSVEFASEHKLTFKEFQDKVKDTIGITNIYGDFVEEYRTELIEFLMFQNLLTKEESSKKVDEYLNYKAYECK